MGKPEREIACSRHAAASAKMSRIYKRIRVVNRLEPSSRGGLADLRLLLLAPSRLRLPLDKNEGAVTLDDFGVTVNGTQQEAATGTYHTGAQYNMTGSSTWTSSNHSVFTVSGGLAQPIRFPIQLPRTGCPTRGGFTGGPRCRWDKHARQSSLQAHP
jgi:hypothetical protein